ncbi:MAG TPA: lipocalin family protein [Pyrinomonadaceae bacterium]
MAVVLAFVSSFGAAAAAAQSSDRIRETWKGPDAALLTSLLKNRDTNQPPNAAARPRMEVVKFTPAGDSGVAKSLGDAFGRTDEERAAVAEAFRRIKQGYEAEVAREGKSNNLAAAMAFFIAANVAAYHQAELPADAATDKLFQSLQETMAGVPAFARLSNPEKQQLHDWLVCMAGFVLTGYTEAKQSGDRESLKSFGELADYSMRLVLGVEVGKLSFAGDELAIKGEGPAARPAGATGGGVVGVWSKSSSSPVGMAGTLDATQKQMVYPGYYKGEYRFNADGTYAFKAERRGGSTGQGFWTTEESGTYAVNGDSLVISPRASKMTLRSLEGAVQKTQNNPLEKVTYRWRTHYFEGLDETQLVLQPPSQTTRDGGFSGNSLFPNSYLYSPGSKLEFGF